MPVDHIRYDILAQQALRGVMRKVLADVGRNGLPGEHHFKITFATGAPDVRLSPRLSTQYPKEMTVVLQHQFWDLTVTDEGFEVGLSFGGIPERVFVPFAAVTGFFDPSVQFGLQFETIEAEDEAAPSASDTGARAEPAPPAARKPEPLTVVPPAQPEAEKTGADVVPFDRFRKK
jgi:hypothetical protein